jgi:hypothetical protein
MRALRPEQFQSFTNTAAAQQVAYLRKTVLGMEARKMLFGETAPQVEAYLESRDQGARALSYAADLEQENAGGLPGKPSSVLNLEYAIFRTHMQIEHRRIFESPIPIP